MTKFNLNNRGNSIIIVMLVALAIIIVALLFVFNKTKQTDSDGVMNSDNAMMEADESMVDGGAGDTMMVGDERLMEDNENMVGGDAMVGEESLRPEDKMMNEESGDAMTADEEMKKNEDAMMDDDAGAMMDKVDEPIVKVDTMIEASGEYKDYSSVAFMDNENKTRVLFFHAGWCPTCKAANSDIVSRLDEIPADVVLFKVDYDKETELKKKYGITYQHTYVQVDARGEAIAKWNGGDIDELKKNIK